MRRVLLACGAARVIGLLALLVVVSGCALAPPAPADGPDGPLLIVLNKADASALLLDAATGEPVDRLPTGVGPHEVAVSPDGRRAVVTDYGDRDVVGATLTVLDLARRQVERTVPLGEYERPHGVAFLPGGRVAVTAERDSAVVVVDLATGVAAASPTGQAASHLLALSPDGRYAYTGNIVSGSVSKVDVAERRTVAVASVGAVAEAVAVTPDGREVWAASQETGRVVALDAGTLREVGTAGVGGRPIRIAFTPDGARALVTAVEGNALHVLDARTRASVAVVPFPAGALPIGIAVAPDGRRAYVALSGLDRVAVIDLEALSVVALFETGPTPDGIAVVAPAP